MFAKVTVVTAVLALVVQDAGVLQVRVNLPDASGIATPVAGAILLVSDNPSTREPRRLRTGPDGGFEVKLSPGTYTVETDRAIAFAGKGYEWTVMVDVTAGRTAIVELGASNANVGELPSSDGGDPRFARLRNSVVEIWTPTTHASGFVIDSRGLIATSYQALNGATDVEVEATTSAGRVKVPGTVIVSDRFTGAAIVRVDSELIAAPPIGARCGRSDWPEPAYRDVVSTITAGILADKDETSGEVSRVTAQAIYADLRIGRGEAGGPVLDADGDLIGISAIATSDKDRHADERWVIPIKFACDALATAVKLVETARKPRSIRLPIEPPVASSKRRDANSPRPMPATLSSSNFDIALMTPAHAHIGDAIAGPRSDFGNWAEYVAAAPEVLLIRVTPQFEEGFWKMLARGAAATQGVALPPLRSFSANFLRMRAFCGETEVTPIHPFVIERTVAGKGVLREGLYVFDREAFAGCPTVRLSIYSEKEPLTADNKQIDPKLLQQVANSLQ
ncbi:MAG TPA: serine protease [Vicinamibacterales bacterium]|nr:serine protease [Vicinamibacterales bacterium]